MSLTLTSQAFRGPCQLDEHGLVWLKTQESRWHA